MKILVFNAGSSSHKCCLYDLPCQSLPIEPPVPEWSATLDWTHQQGIAELSVKTERGDRLQKNLAADNRSAVIAQMLETLQQGETQVLEQFSEIDVVGHRVVHGGQAYSNSVLICPEVTQTIQQLAEFAPLHNPINLEGIAAIAEILGTVPQVAVFDTAFHAHLSAAAAIYPGPYAWVEQGIRRYGFHGISHQYCAHRTAQILGQDQSSLRLISCHLGNGCSLAAIAGDRCLDTTMGFTPLEGLMMGSRSGSVDPGILLYLLRQPGSSVDSLDHTLNQDSGLKGISGISADMRQILAAVEQGEDRARLAFDLYIHRLRGQIGAMLAALGGLDVLVFTAGVGENSPAVRAAASEPFKFLGLELDPAQNAANLIDQDIATPESTVRVVVVHTQEDWAIAQECWRLIAQP
ncbi:MAG: acetate kinase [Aphanocapsa sp. GSE-SYN-MK-11-07L]|jgi:acetate kinase|nr:acetate kinase [Aphanocapsa sp. GSE-SYN-MK-11-07L]